VNSLFFWIIVLAFLVPAAMRLYKRSVRGRNQGTPEQFGQFPGENPGNTGRYPGSTGGYPGQQEKQPRDGYTQRDYYGGFGQLGAPQQPAPVPQEESPEYLSRPPQQPAGPAVPPPPSAPQGFRARKLAELDQRYSTGELAMEDYMAQRAEIMKG
jgi:hypothetical protein